MAKALTDDIVANIHKLVLKTTNYQEGSDEFKASERCALTILKKSDTMYFLNTKDIHREIWSMADKFMFHGFFKHADYLKKLHDEYIDRNLSDADLTPRLNVVKFLLCMSRNPVEQFWENPDKFAFIQEQEETENIDWRAYLNEGIERWSPTQLEYGNDTDSDEDVNTLQALDQTDASLLLSPIITQDKNLETYDFPKVRSELLDSIQSGWFGYNPTSAKALSRLFDANVGVYLEDHLQKKVSGLVELEAVVQVSEYKVIREILWQMWKTHTSTLFALSIDALVPKPDVSIPSLCTVTFENIMQRFVTYITILDQFRQFLCVLHQDHIPETYKCYARAMEKLVNLVHEELVKLEEETKAQGDTITLLSFSERLQEIFVRLVLLKQIHEEIIIDFEENSSLVCSLNLLTKLRRGFELSLNKLEQDLRLLLYLECLYYYLTIVDSWLAKNDLLDSTQEFVISNNNTKMMALCDRSDMNFFLKDDAAKYAENDGMIQLICDDVLQIGRNICLLRLLGKCEVYNVCTETIYEEFVRTLLAKISKFSEAPFEPSCLPSTMSTSDSSFEVDHMGDWSEYVNITDGFLTKAFETFHCQEPEEVNDESLLHKITRLSTTLYPLQNLPEKVFSGILKKRYTISGLMVKNILIENYSLDRQFEFLNYIFLFWDDVIFPFYRKIFYKMPIANSNWGNSVWLTAHLQDILMDHYPTFYEHCTVVVNKFWKQCRDSLEACSLLRLHYEIKWPLNIIITERHLKMYQEIFEVILKLKWGLYTVNHLYFTDLQPKGVKSRILKPKQTLQKLKYLRFNLINVLNSVQHYLFGFVLNRCRIQFELDFEKANDLKSLIVSHENFINAVHRSATEIRDRKANEHGLFTLLKSVKMLKGMWNSVEYATIDNLDVCRNMYVASSAVINDIINNVPL